MKFKVIEQYCNLLTQNMNLNTIFDHMECEKRYSDISKNYIQHDREFFEIYLHNQNIG